jgi:hypothetical protein
MKSIHENKNLKLNYFLHELSMILKNYNIDKRESYEKKEKTYSRNLKKILNHVNKKLKKWYIFSYTNDNKMLKTKKYMLRLHKNIIKRHGKI